MQRVVKQQKVGSQLVQVYAVTETVRGIGGMSDSVENYVVVIDGSARHDLGGVGMGPEELLQMGVEAAREGY